MTLLGAAAPVVEALVASAGGEVRDRVLLEAVLALGAGRAAELWRPTPDVDGPWGPVLARGPSEALPPREAVRAVLSGALDGELGEHRRVLLPSALAGTARVALVLGGPADDPEAPELAEALLTTVAVLERAEGGEAVPASLPRGADDPLRCRARHDLGNLLAGLVATHDLLRLFGSELDEDEAREAASALDSESRRAGHVLADACGGRRGAPRTERPLQVVREVVAAQRAVGRLEGVELAARIAGPDAEVPVALDEAGLTRVLTNLLVNAREALRSLPPGSPREILLEAGPGSDPRPGIKIAVSDRGPGFPSELSDRLFEDGTSSRGPGRGLGLAVVRERVHAAGGTVRAVAQHGGGARFEVWLPDAR